nr:MAG TPA: single-stranded DNA binding protein [Caudoviricetes sp.]
MIDKFNLDTMFAAIQGSFDKGDKQSVDYSNILKFEIGKTYKLRLMPYVDDPSETFFHYIEFGWKSKATDNYVSAISPSTAGEPCPISEVWRKGFQNKLNTSGIRRREQWMVNVYVVDDPSHPENNGTVKIFRYGKQIDKIIQQALQGDLSDELGKSIFDLSSNGYDFIVRCEQQQEFPNYSNSSFARRTSALPGIGDDENKIVELYGKVFKLKEMFKIKTYGALQKMLDEHYYVTNKVSTSELIETEQPYVENAFKDPSNQEVEKATKAVNNAVTKSTNTSTDEDLDELIADL